nr:uncharacterized protein LOC127317965 isoform X5 [Lolium perenne]
MNCVSFIWCSQVEGAFMIRLCLLVKKLIFYAHPTFSGLVTGIGSLISSLGSMFPGSCISEEFGSSIHSIPTIVGI